MLTLSERLDDQGEVDEGNEEQIQLVEAAEDTAESFEPEKQSFDLIQGFTRVDFGGTTGMKPKSNASCRVASPSYARSMMRWQPSGSFWNRAQQFAPLRRIVRLPGREGKPYGAPSTRGNQMNFGAPSAPTLADGL